jgi:geranylgeranyl diphosphate synthase type II
MREIHPEFLSTVSERITIFQNFFTQNIYSLIQTNTHPLLASAILYSLQAGGKRIRPLLAISAYIAGDTNSLSNELKFGITSDILYLASSTELIHTYSLVHDDLPSMDNDSLRRGIPTVHVQFNESTAVLVGDGLNSLAFYVLSKISNTNFDPDLYIDLIQILHEGAGIYGMVSGQSEDLEMEGRNGEALEISEWNKEDTLLRIHRRKTGALILASLLLGNRLRKDFIEKKDNFQSYGEKLGILFQLTDDILDVEGTSKELGKTPGKDNASGKLTFISLYGIDLAKKMRDVLIDELVQLAYFIEPNKEIFFKNLPIYIGNRKN